MTCFPDLWKQRLHPIDSIEVPTREVHCDASYLHTPRSQTVGDVKSNRDNHQPSQRVLRPTQTNHFISNTTNHHEGCPYYHVLAVSRHGNGLCSFGPTRCGMYFVSSVWQQRTGRVGHLLVKPWTFFFLTSWTHTFAILSLYVALDSSLCQ